MYNIKSIKLYFFSIAKLIFLKFKSYFYKTSYYNKKLITNYPERIFYSPSSFLTSLLLENENETYQINDIPANLIWEKKEKNNLKFNTLHSFLWLTKIDRKDSRVSTQSIINSWINKYYNYDVNSWDMIITAKRIISWASNTDITLHESDNDYKKKFFASIIKQSNFLLKNIKILPYDSSRIICSSAIILSGIIFKDNISNFKSGIKELEKIILIYFDKFGFPRSRNPEEVFTSIKYFILLREWLKEADKPIPELLNNIIIKCGECYNFLGNSNKTLPLFNGASEINHKECDNFLKRFKYNFENSDDHLGGLYKIKKNKFELFFDVGDPPSDKFSNSYQAGGLSFELISKGEKIICNSGYGKNLNSKLTSLSSLTATHSTLCLNDTSSSRFQKNKIIKKIYGNSLIHAHKIVEKKLLKNEEAYNVSATHNGYEKKFGYLHKRSIKILDKDNKIHGFDELNRTKNISNSVYYFIRFHIYPGTKIVKTKAENSVLISSKNGQGWLLKSEANKINIEKNIFFGGKRTINNECICVSGTTNRPKLSINWTIEKLN